MALCAALPPSGSLSETWRPLSLWAWTPVLCFLPSLEPWVLVLTLPGSSSDLGKGKCLKLIYLPSLQLEVLELKVTFMGSGSSRHPCVSDVVTKGSVT